MTEKEWVIVTTALTDLFDIVKQVAPERININKMYTAGKLLIQEHDRIRERCRMLNLLITPASPFAYANWSDKKISKDDWQQKNEELEKKKEAQHLEELGDLTQALKLSIEKAEKDRQEE